MADQKQRISSSAIPSTVANPSSVQFLDDAQQHLLLAALNSQTPTQHSQAKASAAVMSNAFEPDFTPEMYDFEGDDSFDFDTTDLGDQMIGGLPDDDSGDAEQHEKRKADEDSLLEGGDSKRQETQEGEKGAKKPGRKPLTNEPTTKRKAQNRAAQRAFRERKEAHLKDLETKVSELTKSSEADKHENGLLRAQVDRLQVELRDYRKRLSLNSSGMSRSPPSAANAQLTKNQMNFNFDFPKFGSLPAAQILGNQNITPPLSNNSPISAAFGTQSSHPSRQNSEGRGISPLTNNSQMNSRSPSQPNNIDLNGNATTMAPFSTNDNMHGFASTLPQMGRSGNDPFGDLFSPSILKVIKQDPLQESSYFNSIASANPADLRMNNKASSNSNANGGDSTAGIPDHRVFRFNSNSIASDSASPSASSLSQWNNNTTNSSCGTSPEPAVDSPANNTKSPNNTSTQQPDTSQYSFTQLPSQPSSNDLNLAAFNNNSFNVPQLDAFDPVLFGDYRDTNDNILGTGDFTGGFFDDSQAPLDFGSPSNLFGILTNSTSVSNQSGTIPTPSHNLMAEIEKARDGGDDDYGLPSTTNRVTTQPKKEVRSPQTGKLISCTNIWCVSLFSRDEYNTNEHDRNQLQSNPDFQDGKFDLDGLCSELRTKARCSESGLMVDSDHVDAALKRLGKDSTATAPGKLLFEQESWDNVLKKLNSAKQT